MSEVKMTKDDKAVILRFLFFIGEKIKLKITPPEKAYLTRSFLINITNVLVMKIILSLKSKLDPQKGKAILE